MNCFLWRIAPRITTHAKAAYVVALTILGFSLSLGLLLGGVHPVAAATSAPDAPAAGTIITVDSSEDLDSGSITKTCNFTSGAVFVSTTDGCTLRRALLEASARPAADHPIEIRFNLPITDVNASLEVTGTWTLLVDDPLPHLDRKNSVETNGDVTIDGDTQPGGRTDGPKIIIATDDHSLEVESEDNIIRNLAFKGGGAIFLKENGNLVENIWMGLSDDGQSIVFRNGGDTRMAGGGIFISADNNRVQNNVIVGANPKAISIAGGDNNIVQDNLIGTRADGTVPDIQPPAECLRSLTRDPQNWYGGYGISLSGSNNTIVRNRLAGLHIVQTQNSSSPVAIEISGDGHTIGGNIIGLDSAGTPVGVCGHGIQVSDTNTQILNNTIVRSRISFEGSDETAILASDDAFVFGQITVRGNIIVDGPGEIYTFGAKIPEVLRTFKPAKITQIDGLNISGGNGDDSPCPGCLIDFYIDDADEIQEAFTHLGSTLAEADGSFTFPMTQTLPSSQGIRTSSTTQSASVIGNYLGGTTTEFSKLYLPMEAISVTGVITGQVGMSYVFTVTVNPADVTTPISYTIDATDKDPLTQSSDRRQVTATYTWQTPGTKTLDVMAENDLGSLSTQHTIEISGPSSTGTPISGIAVTGVVSGAMDTTYYFTITVNPADVTTPISYTVDATDKNPLTLDNSNQRAVVAQFSWNTPGTKTVEITVENELGVFTDTYMVEIAGSSNGDTGSIYLPHLEKQ